MHLKKIACLSAAIIFAGSSAATPRFVATTGADVGTCSTLETACLSLNYTIGISEAGDTVNVDAGSYLVNGSVIVNKSLTILGKQADVDARTRVDAESILNNTHGILVSASNVVINGFTIKGSIDPAGTKFGIWLKPGISQSRILNNIFENNISGLGLSNANYSQAIIQQNLFRNNNAPAPSPNAGTGIYADGPSSGAVFNALIDSNLFDANLNAGIAFNTNGFTNTNITITNNEIRNGGRGVYLQNTQSSSIRGNYIHHLVSPKDQGPGVAIGIWGGNKDLAITLNNLITGSNWGIQTAALIASPNTNITIHTNNIFGFAVAGLQVNDKPNGPADFATCNWWGSASGPTNASLNPLGDGDIVSGILAATNSNPWLLAFKFPVPGSQCGIIPVSLDKSFFPRTIDERETSTLTITLVNRNSVPANIIGPLRDFLPNNMTVVGQATNTCGGVVNAIEGDSVVTLEGGAIPALGYCSVKVKVSGIAGDYISTLPDGALLTNLGSNALASSAHLRVDSSHE